MSDEMQAQQDEELIAEYRELVDGLNGELPFVQAFFRTIDRYRAMLDTALSAMEEGADWFGFPPDWEMRREKLRRATYDIRASLDSKGQS
jgi:hypothetical protein